tara:strand:+ start:342 stop:521 length:180 start_codon:yes stop_codon:yes gene_type:complete
MHRLPEGAQKDAKAAMQRRAILWDEGRLPRSCKASGRQCENRSGLKGNLKNLLHRQFEF